MKYGFVKVAAVTPEIRVADCDYNAQQIIMNIKKADSDRVKILVTPELCITGYTCGDLFNQQTLLEGAKAALVNIAKSAENIEMLIAVGIPLEFERKLYNCAAVIYKGHIIGVVPKCNIPNYGEFYEQRHFKSAPLKNSFITINGDECLFGTKQLFECSEMPDLTVAVEICEDMWVSCPPSVEHTTAGATIILNLSASDEVIGKDSYRRKLVESQSSRLISGYVYADAGVGESTTDMVFSGHNLIAENGTLLSESMPFRDGYAVSEIDVQLICSERRRTTTYNSERLNYYNIIKFSMTLNDTVLTRYVPSMPFVPYDKSELHNRCEAILTIQAQGLKKRVIHSRVKTLLIAVSGGLDSSLAILVAAKTMDILNRPRTDIIAYTMPCFGTTARTKNNAEILCEQLGVTFKCVPIDETVRQHFNDIGHDETDRDVTYENSQARMRTMVLMDAANQYNGLVVGTGDLSELALGWATYNGDHMSMYGVNSSIPKTLIRHIVRYCADTFKSENERLADVLYDILDTPVSPELLPAEKNGDIAQKTEDIVGPYELHDFYLYNMVRFGFAPSKIYMLAVYAFKGDYNKTEILKWLKVFIGRFFIQQFKRSCMPDGPKVGSVTLSPRGDWRMPSDAAYKLWLDEIDYIEGEQQS